jgi:uncharacterized protein (DUF1499 family)
MLKKVVTGIAVVALIFIGYLYLQAQQSNKQMINTQSMKTLKPCPDTPNCVSSQATQPKKKRDAITFEGTAEQAKKRLMMVVGDMARTTLVKDDGNYLHYTFKTWPIPYTDDVEFIIDPDRKVIDYRSASRVGKSDLGVNSRRMAKVVDLFSRES